MIATAAAPAVGSFPVASKWSNRSNSGSKRCINSVLGICSKRIKDKRNGFHRLFLLCVKADPATVGDGAAASRERWMVYVRQVSDPCIAYFRNEVLHHDTMPMYEGVEMANPAAMQRQQLNAADVRLKAAPLVACHLISPAHVDNLIAELAQYQLVCAGIDWDDKSFAEKAALVEEFWACHKRLPAWTKFAHLCMLLQPVELRELSQC